jgi:hypothetical protein
MMGMIRVECGCGAVYVGLEWFGLTFCGVQRDGGLLELRDCACGSTIARDLGEPEEPNLRRPRQGGVHSPPTVVMGRGRHLPPTT